MNATLKQGSYTLTKDIIINDEAYEYYLEDYLENNACILNIEDFLVPGDTSCFYTCEECEEALGTESEYLTRRENEIGTPLTIEQDSLLIRQYAHLLSACWEPCETKNSCDVLYGMLLVDVSLQGQYGTMSSTDPLSVYNINNMLPSFSGGDPDWRNPATPYKDEFGNIALVDNGNGSMVPPEQLTSLQEFFDAYQPSWAESLVPYHPEYKLYEFRKDFCELTHVVQNQDLSSDEFDQLLQTEIDSYDKANGINNWNIQFLESNSSLLFSKDPYFNINYSSHYISGQHSLGLTLNNDFNAVAYDIMYEAIYSNFDGTGMSLLEYSSSIVLCGANFSGSCTGVSSWADVLSLSTQQKNDIWQQYKSNYLGQKLKIEQLIQDFYGFQDVYNIYNGSIGSGGYGYQFLLNFSWYSNFQDLLLSYYILEDFSVPFNGLSLALCGVEYNSKTTRVSRVDELIGGTGNNATDLGNAVDEADFLIWQQTGLCPLMIDMEEFIEELSINDALNTISISDTVHQYNFGLFTSMSGGTSSVGTIVFEGNATSPSSITINVSDDVTSYCNITLGEINGLSWLDYGINWHIYEVSGSYPSNNDPNGADVLITAGIDEQSAQQYLVSYTNDCIAINDCQSEYVNTNGNLNENDSDCDKKENVTAEIIEIMNDKIMNGNFFNSISLQGNPIYIGSEFGAVINNLSYNADWNGTSSSIVFIDPSAPINNNTLLDITLLNGASFPSDIIQIISMDINGMNFTMDILSDPLNPVMSSMEGSIKRHDFRSVFPIDFSCPCEESEYVEGEDLTQFINHLISLESVPHGYVPVDSVIDFSSIWINPSPDPQNTMYLAVTEYEETATGVFMYTDLDSSVSGGGSKCPLTFNFVSNSSYSGSDIAYVMDLYFVNNSGSFNGTAIMNDGASLPITGRAACFVVNQVSSRCEDCEPKALVPVPCNNAYSMYVDKMDSMDVGASSAGAVSITETEFCNKRFSSITNAYLYFLNQLSITNQNSLLFISIAQFGATPLGYDNQLLKDVVDDYVTYVNSVPPNDFPITWNDFLTHDYVKSNNLCPGITPAIEMPDTIIDIPCNQWSDFSNNVNAQNQYDIYIQQLTESFRKAYVEGAMESLVETFTEEHFDKEYHYTLYYYDRAGNLVQTVPPKGVERFDGANTTLNNSINQKRATQPEAHDITLAPAHTYQTVYKYNSLNQLVYQITPDGGESRFAYDALGRLVVSQNAKQKLENQFSYTRYDELGRVYEVGELTAPSSDYSIDDIGKLVDGNGVEFDVNHLNFPDNWSMNRKEVTHSIYDELKYIDGNSLNDILINGSQAQSNFEDYHFDNTRNRILCVMYQEVYDTDLNNYDNASFYNYDVHGNVEELIQVVNDPELIALNQSIKKLSYSYDLVSGNVNEVIYQKGETDEFRHKFNYDADNRITNVFTSKDGVIYEQDAKYFYYDHGPLARTEIGHSKVQAMDYAYTIQGWIKAVNGEEIDEETMMGWDGAQAANSQVASTINKHVAKDAFGYSLSYYDGDYNSSNTAFLNHSKATTPSSPNLNASLYNGNIRSMFTALSDENENALATHQTNYTYDQLNRIKSMKGYNRVVGQVASESGYSSSYSFDANGNLETLKRNAWDGNASILMDDFEYHYNETINNGHNNRLSGITDHAGASLFQDADIDHSITSNNYKYDEIGQLIEDVDEGIDTIKWTVTNKVKEIQYENGDFISFDYDAMGNRIAKHVTKSGHTASTYYFLDAQGNQMAMYQHKNEEENGISNNNLYLSERNLYGSRRIGQEQIGEIIASSDLNLVNINTATQNIIGDKYFEMSNHLGNVLAVVSDRKIPEPDGMGGVAYYSADVVASMDYFPYGMQMPGRSFQSDEYDYGYQGSEKTDEIKGSGNHYTTYFKELDPRLGRLWSIDPKANASESPYVSMSNNPLFFTDPLGDTVKYEKFRDRVNVFFAKTFNKDFRSEHNERKESADVYTYDKDSEFGNSPLVKAQPCEIRCNSGGEGASYSDNVIYYNKGLRIGDIDNSVIRGTAIVGKGLGMFTFEVGRFGLAIPLGLGAGLWNAFAKGDNELGWGYYLRVETNNDLNVLNIGLGDYKKYNMLFLDRKKTGSQYSTGQMHPDNALGGFRYGLGRNRPTQMIEFGQGISFANWRNTYHPVGVLNIRKKQYRRGQPIWMFKSTSGGSL